MCKRPTTSTLYRPIDPTAEHVDPSQVLSFFIGFMALVSVVLEADRIKVQLLQEQVKSATEELQDCWQDLNPRVLNQARQDLNNLQAQVMMATSRLVTVELLYYNLAITVNRMQQEQEESETIPKN